MTRLRTIAALTLVSTIILFVTSRDCTAQRRRDIVGGEKWVWDPVMKQWVYHQGTRTLKANRGINAPPKRSYYDRGSRISVTNATPKYSPRPQQKTAGGKTYVWNPRLKRWVLPPAGKAPNVTKTGVRQKAARSSQVKRVITNPYVGK